ncbi:hypothetical protein QBC42DRAFT_226106 [Cladorrhinum samala]|uniref:Uncharacterized protein n=1 Tax=Cladorrhinum samala TaxID=585594 RepID=A0AAV9HMJ8_9PEZI|nr:hypothetical protein QBC42DRAFT_226106 [Cladorrhinum samala]
MPPPPPPHPHPLPLSRTGLSFPSSEVRTLTTFPTTDLPSPRILPESAIRSFPVRYPITSQTFFHPKFATNKHPSSSFSSSSSSPSYTTDPPFQTQTNRWLCCQCAQSGVPDPVGTIHLEDLKTPGQQQQRQRQRQQNQQGSNQTTADHLSRALLANEYQQREPESLLLRVYNTCWRDACRHEKCVNCVLYAGPLCRDYTVKSGLIRTVGGMFCSPRFLDPVHWECLCGEWKRNRFNARCVCMNPACGFRWTAGMFTTTGRGGGGSGFAVAGGGATGGAGVLGVDTVVMNRYGQRLGSADQRMAVKGGPWDWQRRALGDERCALLRGVREAMRRDFGRDHGGLVDAGGLWREGEPVPRYPYRRPPPLDEDDPKENFEYEASYLAGIPLEPVCKGKEKVGPGPGAGGNHHHLLQYHPTGTGPGTSLFSSGYGPSSLAMQM